MSRPLPGFPGHMFLSYARADGIEQARQLEMVLRLEGFATWRDTRDLALSADFTSEIENAIRSSLAVVVCVTHGIIAADSFVRHLTPPEARDLIIGSYVESRYEKENAHQRHAGRTPLSLDEIYLRLGSLAMNDAGGGGNRNLFATSDVKIRIDHDDTYSLIRDMNIMVSTGTRSLRFYHLELRDHFAFRYAVRAMKGPDAVVRNRAAWALWQIPDRRALSILLESLSDPDPFTRGGVVSALGSVTPGQPSR